MRVKKLLFVPITAISILAFTACGIKEVKSETITASESSPAALLSEAKDTPSTALGKDTTQETVSAQDTAYITEEDAMKRALAHAGLTEEQIKFVRVEFDKEVRNSEYEIEFYTNDKEYDYEIDAVTGDVLACDFDIENFDRTTVAKTDDNKKQSKTDATTTASKSTTTDANTSATTKTDNNSSISQNTQKATITKEQAKNIALKHANITEDKATFVRVELDYDDNRAEYEVEFYVGNIEYDYDIDAADGKILSYDQDAEYYDGKTNTTKQNTATNTQKATITKEQAKNIALKHANITGEKATFVRVELDYDDNRAEYEVEFYVGNIEYDYDIDAADGKILSYDQDAEYYDGKTNSTDNNKKIDVTSSATEKTETSSTNNTEIGRDKAKQIALNHAGLKESDISRFEISMDRDDGRTEYEVEFNVGRTEYSYDIDASSGRIIDYEVDED